MRTAGRFLFVAAALLACSCGGAQQRAASKPRVAPAPPPAWVRSVEIRKDELCGIGVAGAGYDVRSPYPRRLAEERAVRNLAGVLETRIQEAIIDRSTADKTTVDFARALHVDSALIDQVAQMVKTEFWYDAAGSGPFAQKGFTYGRRCNDAQVAADRFALDRKAIQGNGRGEAAVDPNRVPAWLTRTGKQPGGRLCAVGFSLPTFHPDKTFEIVVEDVRAQLADVLQTLVSSYTEELTTERYQLYEAMTVATTQAVSKGAIVTQYWYDRDGIGPEGRKRSTYGWGCVYPVDVMLESVSQVEQALPEQTVAKVRERAEKAFDELDTEIEKRAHRDDTPPAPMPDARELPAPELEAGMEAMEQADSAPAPGAGDAERTDSAAPAPDGGSPRQTDSAPAPGAGDAERTDSAAPAPDDGSPRQTDSAPAPGAGGPGQTGAAAAPEPAPGTAGSAPSSTGGDAAGH